VLIFPGVKRPKLKAGHSLPSSTHVNSELFYTPQTVPQVMETRICCDLDLTLRERRDEFLLRLVGGVFNKRSWSWNFEVGREFNSHRANICMEFVKGTFF
jgi:hypothetical protein